MLNDWLYIGLFFLLAWIFPGAPILIARFLSPNKPNAIKNQTYECGIETYGDTWVQFKVQYYNFALTFLVFDVEIVFLFPWAVAFDQLSLFGVLAGAIFILVLFAELIGAWQKGALEWV
jgi:NADH:ubiquinone oxidoreductase subunit 3 (subunit A)